TNYRLSETVLTPKLLADEYTMKLSSVNSVAFFKEALEEEKSNLSKGTFKRHESVLKKLKEYNSNIHFYEINLNWFTKYKIYLKKVKKNNDATVEANVASIKKFIGIAENKGINLQLKISDIHVGSTRGNRNYL